jgi:hypothetical protein
VKGAAAKNIEFPSLSRWDSHFVTYDLEITVEKSPAHNRSAVLISQALHVGSSSLDAYLRFK